MNINRICEYCSKSFTAQKTTTRYCSDFCSKRAYKQRIKDQKIQTNEQLYLSKLKGFDILEIQKKEFLSVREAMFLLDISRMTIHRMIRDGRLTKLEGLKAVRLRRSDIDKLFNFKSKKTEVIEEYKLPHFSNENYYSINEVLEKFGVSSGTFYNLCKKNNIPKIPKGKFVYVPRDLVNKIFNNE
ncbi:hypothetical protein CBW16_10130 [Flavobacteriaceae bacterium JJC]|nr:hypothetical protein CBW16_10130 [Flavobacteriaceae bacterium JJC]